MLQDVEVIHHSDLLPSRREEIHSALAREFPSIFVSVASDRTVPPMVSSSQWRGANFDHSDFDVRLDELASAPFTLRINDDRGEHDFPIEVLNRCQRLIGRRNQHSHGPLFDRVLRRHREMHDLSKRNMRAAYNHALDAWQWTLRLDAAAWVGVQIAALFHNVGFSESAAAHEDFKEFHARAGAEITWRVLAESGVNAALCDHILWLVFNRERPSADPDIALLNDAAALSFFSFGSSGHADRFGPDKTTRAMAHTWSRMRPAARAKLESVRLREDVLRMLDQVRESDIYSLGSVDLRLMW